MKSWRLRKSKSQQKLASPTRNYSRQHNQSRGISYDKSLIADRSAAHISSGNMFDFPYANTGLNDTSCVERSWLEQSQHLPARHPADESMQTGDVSRNNHEINYVNTANPITNIKDAKSYKYLVENLTRNVSQDQLTMMHIQGGGDGGFDPSNPIYKQEFSLMGGSSSGMCDPARKWNGKFAQY